MLPILTVTLNPAVDKFMVVPGFCAGAESHCSHSYEVAGGKGINVSRMLKRLNVDTIATGILGGGRGQFISRELLRENIPADFQLLQEETRLNLTLTDPLKGQTTRVLESGPEVKPADIRAFKKRYSYLLNSCQVVVFSGSCMRGFKEDVYQSLIQQARKKGVKTVLDSSGKFLRSGLKAGPDCVKPNRQEAEDVLGQSICSRSDLKAALATLNPRRVVLLSLGEEGLAATDGKKAWTVRPPSVKIRNTVGCGDALLAGFLYAEIHGYEFPERLCYAVAAGTAHALRRIPGYASKAVFLKTKRILKAVPL
ncbi:MAG: 1-phosphofructokinase family hexose kinase [Candidatus Omnitrophota bacterium]